MRGLGVDGLEQIVTADPENGVLVTKIAKGRPLPEISSGDLLKQVSKKHIAKLEKTLGFMVDNLLEFDNSHNVLFDPKEGFTFVDYRTPLGLRADKEYSANIDDENYDPAYVTFLESHSLASALDILLSSKKRYFEGLPNEAGEETHYLKPTLGRRAVKSLVKLKIR